MAEVTGKTSEKLDELLGEQIVGANLSSGGTLTFTKKNGSAVNAGSLGSSVVGATVDENKHLIFTLKNGDTFDAGSLVPNILTAWPVGAVYISVVNTNPATLLGGGTWAVFAKGRMLIGVDPADTSFDAVEETGGSKTKTLLPENLPPHTHTMAHYHEPQDAGDNFLINNAGGAKNRANGTDLAAVGGSKTGPSSSPNTGNGPGNSAPFDVLNPYITVYMWKRTA